MLKFEDGPNTISLTRRKAVACLTAATLLLGASGCGFLGTQEITVPSTAQDLGRDGSDWSFAFTEAESEDAYKVNCDNVGNKSFEHMPNGDIIVTCSTSYDQEVTVLP